MKTKRLRELLQSAQGNPYRYLQERKTLLPSHSASWVAQRAERSEQRTSAPSGVARLPAKPHGLGGHERSRLKPTWPMHSSHLPFRPVPRRPSPILPTLLLCSFSACSSD